MPCFFNRIFADVGIFWSKISKILPKFDHFQIPINSATNNGKNDTDSSLESTEIVFYIDNNILWNLVKFSL